MMLSQLSYPYDILDWYWIGYESELHGQILSPTPTCVQSNWVINLIQPTFSHLALMRYLVTFTFMLTICIFRNWQNLHLLDDPYQNFLNH